MTDAAVTLRDLTVAFHLLQSVDEKRICLNDVGARLDIASMKLPSQLRCVIQRQGAPGEVQRTLAANCATCSRVF